ncbi:TolC family protein [Janthinobacterium sp. RB2R34]|uniref:TolC family protein n=1 Tax=Janthinobacterium sp. RB2R34 TaxID=3424193 RepID=UPI003F229442
MSAKLAGWRALTALAALALPCMVRAGGPDLSPLSADPLGARAGMARPEVMPPGDGPPPGCEAEALAERPLGVVEVIDLAICHNPQLRMAWAAVKQQAGALGEARAAYLPSLSANVSRLRTDNHTGGPAETVTGNTMYSALNWQIYDFGLRAANEHAADSLLQAALASNDAALQKNMADTIQAYFDVQSARAAWQARQLGTTTAASTLASAQRRESNGVLARSDRLQAATALARAQLDRNRALGAYRKATALLVYIMGLPPQSEVTLIEDDDIDSAQAVMMQLERLEQWLQTAQQAHPAIRAARAEWEAAQSRTAAISAENKPSIVLSANAYKNGYPGQGLSASASQVRTVGITLNIPLFDGYAHGYKVQGAEAVAEQKEQALVDTEHRILMEVVKVHADAMAALDNLQASQTLMEAAQDSMRTFERKYDRGASDIVEILAAQAALADAREQRIICVAEWRSARLRLMADSGVLGRHSLLDSAQHAAVPAP